MKAIFTRHFFKLCFIVHFTFFIFLFSFVRAQIPTVQDCMGAIAVCQDVYVEENSYSGDGNYNNEIYNPGGDCTTDCPGSCLDGEQNSVWYIFTVQVGGLLRFTIDPVGSGDDYDWAVYDLTELRCSDIYTSYPLMQKSCNAYGQAPNGNTGISTPNGGTSNCSHCGGAGTNIWNKDLPVTEGRTYVLIVENWSGTTEGYTLDFSGSTAIIYDDVRPELALVHTDDITCGDTQITVEFTENVKCESVDPTDFQLSGPGEPYTILDAQGQACLVGGVMEKQYTLIIDKPIRNDGDYSIELKPLNFVYDACNNFALGNTIVFNVDLGAPVVNVFALEIEAATCGLSNGSITGLSIIGTPPYTFQWTDELGNVVGTTLDLVDVPSGNYRLLITDQNTCATIGGPYFVDQTGAPYVDDAALLITGANYGWSDGQITGLAVTGNEPFTFLWMDADDNPVGSEIDLLNIPFGNYFLLITDAYGCDTLAGPYFVDQIGGPIGVLADSDPTVLCAGGSAQLTATGYGGNPEFYTFQWSSNPPGFVSDIQNPLVFPAITTTYTVTISDGYNVTSASTTVTVNPVPVANSGPDQNIPYGTSTTLHGSASNGTSTYYYAWEPADLLISPTSQNTATQNLYGTTVFRLKATDANTGCQSTYDTVVVSLEGGPLGVTVSSQDDTICKGSATMLTAYGFGGDQGNYTYTWYKGTEVLKTESGDISTLEISPATNGNHTFTVKIFDGFNEYLQDITVFVAPTPSFIIQAPGFTFNQDQIVVCPSDTVQLQPSNLYTGADYYWNNGSTEPYIKISTTGIGYVIKSMKLSITNTEGCASTDSVTVVFDFAACFGIEEYSSFPRVNVYPNPTHGLINVELEDADAFSFLQVINQQGALVCQKDINNLSPGKKTIVTDLSALPKGIYMLRAIHDRFIYHQKVILN